MLFDMADKSMLCKGIVERIGMDGTKLTYQARGQKVEEPLSISRHSEALKSICGKMADAQVGVIGSLQEIGAIGHRVLHGGAKFSQPILVDDDVKKVIRDCFLLGPLHNPANLGGIEACEEAFPGVPNVAVFDTAFHMSMGPEAYMYAIPRKYYDKYAVRKYGFHGTSHKYVYGEVCRFLGLDPASARVISCHLGNGSSVCAVKGGKVVDTILNKKSGLLGVSGISSDMRDIDAARAAGNEHAREAYEMFIHRLVQYVGGYYFLLGGADAILFTGGIGENSPETRERIVGALGVVGCRLDEAANQNRGKEIVISKPGSVPVAAVIPTNEELMIAMETVAICDK